MKRLLLAGLLVVVIAAVAWLGYLKFDSTVNPPLRLPPVNSRPAPPNVSAPTSVPLVTPLPPSFPTEVAPTPSPSPAPVLPLPPDAVADRIQIRKAARELTLYRGGLVLKTYGVALGSNPDGHKEVEGDGRTPEGRYAISGRNPLSKYHLALRISYPSATDRTRAAKRGKSAGGDIMIHGLPNGYGFIGATHRLRDWTIGCVAVTDEEIEEIWRVVPDGCVVDIEP